MYSKTNKCKYGRTHMRKDCYLCSMYGKCELTERRGERVEKGIPFHRNR